MAALILLVLSGTICQVARASSLYFCMGLFLLVVTLVNLYWWSIYYELITLKAVMFYVYNSLTVVSIITIIRTAPNQVLMVTQVGLVTGILVETAAVVFMPTSTFRGVGTFNNPNQLGYWALLVAVCWLVTRGDRRLSMLDLGVLAIVGYLVAVSLSKAAMIAFGVVLAVAAVGQGLRSRSLIVAFSLLAVSSQLWLAMPDQLQVQATDRMLEGPIAKVLTRFESLGKHGDDSVAGRGYDRIWRYPEYLFFGAGEGVTYRLLKGGDEFNELHSTWGTVLFSYGIVGFSSFVAMIVVIFRKAPWRHYLYFMPIVLYGLTHQGLRFTMLWVFWGLVFGLAHTGGRAKHPLSATDHGDRCPPRLANGIEALRQRPPGAAVERSGEPLRE